MQQMTGAPTSERTPLGLLIGKRMQSVFPIVFLSVYYGEGGTAIHCSTTLPDWSSRALDGSLEWRKDQFVWGDSDGHTVLPYNSPFAVRHLSVCRDWLASASALVSSGERDGCPRVLQSMLPARFHYEPERVNRRIRRNLPGHARSRL